MLRRASSSVLVLATLLTCLYSGESSASEGGQVSDGGYITVPWGTVNDWVVFVAPRDMGFEEPGSEGDNAMLKIQCHTVQINQYTWQVVARYKMRPWNSYGVWYSGSANYLLVPK
jgi:hypothetical protein